MEQRHSVAVSNMYPWFQMSYYLAKFRHVSAAAICATATLLFILMLARSPWGEVREPNITENTFGQISSPHLEAW